MYAKPKLGLIGNFNAAAIPAALKIEFEEHFCNFELLRTIVKMDDMKLADELSKSSSKRFFTPAEFKICCNVEVVSEVFISKTPSLSKYSFMYRGICNNQYLPTNIAAFKIAIAACSNVKPPCKKTVYGSLIGASALSSIDAPCTNVPAAIITLSS